MLRLNLQSDGNTMVRAKTSLMKVLSLFGQRVGDQKARGQWI